MPPSKDSWQSGVNGIAKIPKRSATTQQESNPGPLGRQSCILTTEPPRPNEIILGFFQIRIENSPQIEAKQFVVQSFKIKQSRSIVQNFTSLHLLLTYLGLILNIQREYKIIVLINVI